ncbi:MAG: hypothetical protein P8L46_11565 [Acidimicrobiales bacterium]|nr:hypothetical protein [Acidimicrobiales bacterium]MDG2218666.1 hypothetical protein [Acidimicrobiales bacterium]
MIIAGGPAGNSCARTAARLGAEVVLIERHDRRCRSPMGLSEVDSDVGPAQL